MTGILAHKPQPLGLFPDSPTPRLYDRIIDALRVHHDSRRTEEAYVGWIRRFIQLHPRAMGEAEVTAGWPSVLVNQGLRSRQEVKGDGRPTSCGSAAPVASNRGHPASGIESLYLVPQEIKLDDLFPAKVEVQLTTENGKVLKFLFKNVEF